MREEIIYVPELSDFREILEYTYKRFPPKVINPILELESLVM